MGLGDYFDLFPLWPLSSLLDNFLNSEMVPCPGASYNCSLGIDVGLYLEEGSQELSYISKSKVPIPNNHYLMAEQTGSIHRLTEHMSHWTNCPGQAVSNGRSTGARLLCDREEARTENHMEKAVAFAIKYRGCLLS